MSEHVRTPESRWKTAVASIAAAAMLSPVAIGQAAPEEATVQAAVDPIAEFRKGALPPDAPNLGLPVLLKRVNPVYTSEAMRARIAGTVDLEVVISAEGVMERARIVKGLEPGLDQNALTAVRQWLFRPATLDGKPATVWTSITMPFRIF